MRYLSKLRETIPSLPSAVMLLGVVERASTEVNHDGFVDTLSRFGLTESEFRKARSELLDLNLIDYKKEGRLGFVRVSTEGQKLIDTCEINIGLSKKSWINTCENRSDSLVSNSITSSLNKSLYINTNTTAGDTCEISRFLSTEVLEQPPTNELEAEFEKFWSDWGAAIKRLPQQAKCKRGLKHKARRKWDIVRKHFTKNEIRMACRSYFVEKRGCGHPTQHCERFLVKETVYQYLHTADEATDSFLQRFRETQAALESDGTYGNH